MEILQVPESVKKDVEHFISVLKNTEEYLDYRQKSAKVEEDENLKNKLQEYRIMNYNLQQELDPEAIRQRTQDLERMYDELEHNPVAADFLDAEMTFCRMMQEVNLAIYASMDIE